MKQDAVDMVDFASMLNGDLMVGDNLRIDSDITLRGADFEVETLRLWIKYGDMSRYHEIISLDREVNGDWVLKESYVVPGNSYWNETKLAGVTNMREWLIDFMSENKETSHMNQDAASKVGFASMTGNLVIINSLRNGLKIKSDIVLRGTDFEVEKLRLWIKNKGDMSHYHEIITLNKYKGVWTLVEDYLTPKFSYQNETELIGVANIRKWLIDFISENKKYISGYCPPEGLRINCGGELKE